jgi:hypothetical protein
MLAFAGMQAAGSISQGMAANAAGQAQQTIYNAQAIAERDAAAAEAAKIGRRTEQARGAAKAALAGAGVTLDSATSLDIGQDITQRGAEDARMTLLTGERRARELVAQGDSARRSGRNALFQSVLRAGSSVAQGWAMSGSSSDIVRNNADGTGVTRDGRRIF